jgi:hypothetical protein
MATVKQIKFTRNPDLDDDHVAIAIVGIDGYVGIEDTVWGGEPGEGAAPPRGWGRRRAGTARKFRER